MSIEAILGGLAFVALFTLWVILPSRVRRTITRSGGKGIPTPTEAEVRDPRSRG